MQFYSNKQFNRWAIEGLACTGPAKERGAGKLRGFAMQTFAYKIGLAVLTAGWSGLAIAQQAVAPASTTDAAGTLTLEEVVVTAQRALDTIGRLAHQTRVTDSTPVHPIHPPALPAGR